MASERAEPKKLPGRYKGGRLRTTRLIQERTRHAVQERHSQLDRELSEALRLDDERERARG